MQLWSHIGVISAFVFMGVGVPMLMPEFEFQKKTRTILLVVVALTFLLFMTAVIWPAHADAVLYPKSEMVFSAKNTDEMTNISLLQEVDSGRYYIIGENPNNLIIPTYREYLSDAEAKTYIAQYKTLETARNEFINSVARVIDQ